MKDGKSANLLEKMIGMNCKTPSMHNSRLPFLISRIRGSVGLCAAVQLLQMAATTELAGTAQMAAALAAETAGVAEKMGLCYSSRLCLGVECHYCYSWA